MTFLTSTVEDRWIEAIAAPTIPRWRTLASMARQIADAIAESDPDNIAVVAHRAVHQEAHARMLAMQPRKETV